MWHLALAALLLALPFGTLGEDRPLLGHGVAPPGEATELVYATDADWKVTYSFAHADPGVLLRKEFCYWSCGSTMWEMPAPRLGQTQLRALFPHGGERLVLVVPAEASPVPFALHLGEERVVLCPGNAVVNFCT